MLLLLTLALLVSPTCWAHVGRPFSTPLCSNEEVKGVRMTESFTGYLTSLQVKLGENWDVVHGHKRGTLKEFNLDEGEYITEVRGCLKINLRYLVLCTNLPRCVSFGVMDTPEFFFFPPKKGQVLKGFKGSTGLLFLKSLSCIWGDVHVDPITVPPTGTNTTSSP
ncbi:pancreatic adenocarcinoma up-regulated factor [Cavia porcellus]|uniref:pancreatic adenocarcinoma up-regulated factor n=1 Tax=Cavia porcellus TaxID=10141 RepID=UPI002FDFDE86